MTVIELIEALKRFDDTDLVVIENHEGDYMPLADYLTRVRIGVNAEHYDCAAVGVSEWSRDVEINYVIPEED